MTKAMAKYYKADSTSKSNAAIIIQKCVRRYLERKFNFKRAFVMKDKGLQRKIQDKIIARKKVLSMYVSPNALLKLLTSPIVCVLFSVADGGAL